MDLEALKAEYKFRIEKDKLHEIIDHLIFEDGRQYKLQHPTFMQIHEVIFSSKNIRHDVFLFGLTCLYPENDKSPYINEAWLDKNRGEGFGLWSALLRGLLLRD